MQPDRSAKLTGWLLVSLALAGCGPLIAGMFGVRFIASTEWVEQMRGAASAVAACCAIVGGVSFYATRPANTYLATASSVKAGLAISVIAMMMAISGYLLVLNSAPMMHAAYVSQDTQHGYRVESAELDSQRYCPSMLRVQAMPIWLALCGVPPDFANTLEVGDRILVVGTGSEIGVFYSGFLPG